MKLSLRSIIEVPGAGVPFECSLPPEDIYFPSVKEFAKPPFASGKVMNTAGVLNLTGTLTAEMVCVCDRCSKEFSSAKELELDVPLAADLDDEENPEVFAVRNDEIDLTEVLETCLILDMETKFLCSEDCKGLCPVCGHNLNEGDCGCEKPVDPRLAVLGQLLDIDE